MDMMNMHIPFTVRILGNAPATSATTTSPVDHSRALPASFRTRDDHIVVPHLGVEFLKKELLTKRIDHVRSSLWICGRPMPPRPLHHQRLLSRDITITENPELHMVWHKSRIFLKPLPQYLLDPDFWQMHILPGDYDVAQAARGFIFSYCALIMYESDFRLAKNNDLLPKDIEWDDWRSWVAEVLEHHTYARVNARYWYGELRLSRLNKIYRYQKGYILRGFSKVAAHTVYIDLFRDNFAALAGILGYVVIVLTAMQVGLGVEKLQSDSAFQDVSYGFTVFSLIAPLIATVAIILAVFVMFVGNWIATKQYEPRRFRAMGLESPHLHHQQHEPSSIGKTDSV